jgi:4-hydroxybenzoate polyprenyltransferase
MSEHGLTREDPWIRRILAWVSERFPLANGILTFVLFTTALLFSRLVTGVEGQPIQVGFVDVIPFFAYYGFFFMLRVFDEHKDYELDCHNHPERVLQSGLITLTDLKILGAIAIIWQGIVSAWLDGWTLGTALGGWLVVITWSSLMAKEFFIGEWLSKRLFLYALSHMVVMPMGLVWAVTMASPGVALPPVIYVLAGFSFVSGFTFEISRKIKTPEDERDTIDSYTRIFGTKGAPTVALGLVVLGALILCYLMHLVIPEVHAGWYAAALAVPVLVASPFLKFIKEPNSELPKKIEAASGGALLLSYIILAVAIGLERGVTWL